MEWNLAFALVSLGCPATSDKNGGGGGGGDEKLIAMIPGEIHLLLQAVLFCVHFCLEDECRMTELKRLYIYNH